MIFYRFFGIKDPSKNGGKKNIYLRKVFTELGGPTLSGSKYSGDIGKLLDKKATSTAYFCKKLEQRLRSGTIWNNSHLNVVRKRMLLSPSSTENYLDGLIIPQMTVTVAFFKRASATFSHKTWNYNYTQA